jgi:hypothetical protein
LFKAHADYLSLTSNVVEEYTLLVCVTPEAAATVGGETLISLPQRSGAAKQIISKATTTPGRALLFRKDLTHEGLLLQAGAKARVAQRVGDSQGVRAVLLVTFPGQAMGANGADGADDAGGADGADGASGAGAPLHALFRARSYAKVLRRLQRLRRLPVLLLLLLLLRLRRLRLRQRGCVMFFAFDVGCALLGLSLVALLVLLPMGVYTAMSAPVTDGGAVGRAGCPRFSRAPLVTRGRVVSFHSQNL